MEIDEEIENSFPTETVPEIPPFFLLHRTQVC
jgi:hypothetical protein